MPEGPGVVASFRRMRTYRNRPVWHAGRSGTPHRPRVDRPTDRLGDRPVITWGWVEGGGGGGGEGWEGGGLGVGVLPLNDQINLFFSTILVTFIF